MGGGDKKKLEGQNGIFNVRFIFFFRYMMYGWYLFEVLAIFCLLPYCMIIHDSKWIDCIRLLNYGENMEPSIKAPFFFVFLSNSLQLPPKTQILPQEIYFYGILKFDLLSHLPTSVIVFGFPRTPLIQGVCFPNMKTYTVL